MRFKMTSTIKLSILFVLLGWLLLAALKKVSIIYVAVAAILLVPAAFFAYYFYEGLRKGETNRWGWETAKDEDPFMFYARIIVYAWVCLCLSGFFVMLVFMRA